LIEIKTYEIVQRTFVSNWASIKVDGSFWTSVHRRSNAVK